MVTSDLLSSNLIELIDILHKFDESDLEVFSRISTIVSGALKNNKTVFWCGNGGSAAESSHLATELIGRFKSDRPPLSSISLNADTSALTCIANDFGYSEIFSRQLNGIGKSGDVLIALSTSGNSENINNVIRMANEMEIISIAFLGKGGGKAKSLAKYSIIVNSNNTARIQETHLLLGHSICEFIERDYGYA